MTLESLVKSSGFKLIQVAGFMSGSGSNLRELITSEQNYKISVIFTNTLDSNAESIGKEYDIPVEYIDSKQAIKEYYEKEGVSGWIDLSEKQKTVFRKKYDLKIVNLIKRYNIDCVVLAGYMRIVSDEIFDNYLTLNIHPANLRILEDEKRKYVGANAVELAMNDYVEEIFSTVHLVNQEVDGGKILIISNGVTVDYDNKTPEENQEVLKKKGDWLIFPKALNLIGKGMFKKNVSGELFFDEKLITDGVLYKDVL